MNVADAAKLLQLAKDIYDIEEKVRAHPPADVDGYTALVGQLSALYAEYHALLTTGEPTPDDIAKITEGFKTKWSKPWNPGETKPPVINPPTPVPATGTLVTFTWYANPIPSNDELKARSGMARGSKWKNHDGTQWAITEPAGTMPDGDFVGPF